MSPFFGPNILYVRIIQLLRKHKIIQINRITLNSLYLPCENQVSPKHQLISSKNSLILRCYWLSDNIFQGWDVHEVSHPMKENSALQCILQGASLASIIQIQTGSWCYYFKMSPWPTRAKAGNGFKWNNGPRGKKKQQHTNTENNIFVISVWWEWS